MIANTTLLEAGRRPDSLLIVAQGLVGVRLADCEAAPVAQLGPGELLGHSSNPNKAFMDHVLDWKLIHRDEADMHRLFAQSKFGRDCTHIWFEDAGINLFAECVKN